MVIDTVDDRKQRDFLWLVVIMHLSVLLTVFLDIPIGRQILCFIYLIFVPGIVLLNILGMDKLDRLEKTLFSLGLSIAFLMIVGEMLNYLGPSIGIAHPLTVVPLMIAIASPTLLLSLVCFITRQRMALSVTGNWHFHRRTLILLTVPILAVAGAMLVNTNGNSSILLLMIVIVALVSIFSITSEKVLPSELYPIVLLAVAAAILFQSTLVSNFIHGPDIHLEYYLFKLTQANGVWNPQISFADLSYGNSNTMLSVTVLPTMFSNVMNLDPTLVFQIVFPLIFAFVPLGVYKLAQPYFGERISLVSALLFVSESTFVLITALAKEMIGELFFVLLFIVILTSKIEGKARTACFAVFSFALVTAHYSMALVFLFLGLFVWILLFFQKKRSVVFKSTLLLLFFSIMFTWYIFIYFSSPFVGIVEFLRYTYSGLGDFFNPASRGSEVLVGIGAQVAPDFLQLASRIFAYLIQAIITVGVIVLLFGKTKKANDEFRMLVLLNVVILALCILVPRFALSLNMSRFYHITLFFLAPMFAFGCKTLVTIVTKNKAKLYILLTLAILIPYLLFQTGLVYEITKHESWSPPLSMYRMGIRTYTIEFNYVQEQDVFGAEWLSKSVEGQTGKIYADYPSVFNVLASYGMFYRDVGGRMEILTNVTRVMSNGTVFLSKMNVENGIIEGQNAFLNSSDVLPQFNYASLVYSNGYTAVLRQP